MKGKIDFLWDKINKCKSEKNRAILRSIVNDEIVLQGFREHLTLMRTEPTIIERRKENGDISLNMSVSYSVFSKQMEEELKHKIILWLVENIDKGGNRLLVWPKGEIAKWRLGKKQQTMKSNRIANP